MQLLQSKVNTKTTADNTRRLLKPDSADQPVSQITLVLFGDLPRYPLELQKGFKMTSNGSKSSQVLLNEKISSRSLHLAGPGLIRSRLECFRSILTLQGVLRGTPAGYPPRGDLKKHPKGTKKKKSAIGPSGGPPQGDLPGGTSPGGLPEVPPPRGDLKKHPKGTKRKKSAIGPSGGPPRGDLPRGTSRGTPWSFKKASKGLQTALNRARSC